MKKIFLFFVPIVLMILSITSCEEPTEPEEIMPDSLPAVEVEWNENNSIVCFGTSLTYGDFGTGVLGEPGARPNSDSTYPALLDKELRIKVYNEGYWGATTQEALEFYPSVLEKSPSLIILEFGANEFLKDIEVEKAKADIDSLIKMIITDNIQIVMLSFVNPDMLNSIPSSHPFASKSELGLEYYQMLLDLAGKYDIPIDDYLYRDIWGKPEFLSIDRIHPNSKGNAQLKDNVFETFYNTFVKNGMLN